jgi:glycosyltransferase involved in cell wall biosynthesis
MTDLDVSPHADDVPEQPVQPDRDVQLSLCMIVKNEAHQLRRCLDSVQELVDQVVVLDTGSTDETVAIAQEYRAQVERFEWNDDFSAARNASLQYATGDWVLVLDADEELVTAQIPAIRQTIVQDNALVVNLVRQEVGATQSPYSLVSRLFRRHPALQFHRPYHAMIDDSVGLLLAQEPQWQIIDLPDVAILHYGYEPMAIADRNKLERARVSMERFLVTHPGEPYVCAKLGALYVQMGRLNHGIELLERGLKAKSIDTPVRYELHYHLGIAYSRAKHVNQAAQHYQAALQQPLLPRLKLGAYVNLGSLRQQTGDLEGAKSLYSEALDIDPEFAIAHNNLGMTLKAMGQVWDAISHYCRAIETNPDYAEAYQNLGVLLLKLGNTQDGLTAFKQAIALHQMENPAEANRLRQGLRQMGFQV